MAEKPLTIFGKSSMLDVSQGSEYTFVCGIVTNAKFVLKSC